MTTTLTLLTTFPGQKVLLLYTTLPTTGVLVLVVGSCHCCPGKYSSVEWYETSYPVSSQVIFAVVLLTCPSGLGLGPLVRVT